MRKQIVAGALAAAAMLGTAAPALAQGQSCFFTTQWRGWKAPDDHTIYINVDNGHRTYRLDLSGSCPALLDPTSSVGWGPVRDSWGIGPARISPTTTRRPTCSPSRV